MCSDTVLQRQAPVDPFVRRPAVLGRTRNGNAASLVQFDPLQVARPVDQPDGAIEIGFGEIGILVRHEGEADIGIPLPELCQPRCEPLRIEFARAGYRVTVRSLARLHGGHAFFELQKPFAQRVQTGRAFLCQFEPLAGATKQHGAQVIL